MSDPTNAPSSFDYFGKTPKGVEMALHLDLTGDWWGDAADALVDYLHDLDIKLSQKGFTRSDRLDKPVRGGGGPAPRPAPTIVNQEGETVEVKCPKCSGAVWDNRPKKATGEYKAGSPDFKCKNKECGGVIWPPKQPVAVSVNGNDDPGPDYP